MSILLGIIAINLLNIAGSLKKCKACLFSNVQVFCFYADGNDKLKKN